MSLPTSRFVWTRFAAALVAGAAALISSLWIAICAAAPEFLWQGSELALAHVSRAALLSALLIGLVLAFFIDPLMERARYLLSQAPLGKPVDARPRNPLFAASVGLAFALATVSLHEAMITFVSGGSGEDGGGLAAAMRLTIEWAIVPFFVTLAWLSAERRLAAIVTGIVAGASPFAAKWIFSWSWTDVTMTAIPCASILIVGYNLASKEPRRRAFARCARGVLIVAVIWLTMALLYNAILDLYRLDQPRLYNWSGLWVDARFYAGWALGLALAPVPDPSTPHSA